ncbi:hypothetical protein QWY75_00845 [Pontixanthobacter aestiaquae]|uniref:2-keto-4-pentenoate hydratase n=1 Tax=Pontixanthobacter aestiaquae TaxID=1509367 RepID=A0A844Z8V6_9SPHN|nr:hypothetical protein [Pontixanthobacter aestiaquae]MDN3644745.1 hypothetical protein [Pontixanthobacter aestiaquae]MXO84248.1 hypothetical protein [Pontixanthobacter aestiaquae]
MGHNIMTSAERLRSISQTLSEARRAAKALPGFPGELPGSFADAYEVQRLSRERWADDVAGWKVGGVPSAFIEQFGETRLVGPIFARSVVRVSPGEMAKMPVFAGAFGAIEPEFVIELGESRDQDRLYIGAEIASSPLPAINDIGPIAVICDFGNNNGLLIGDEIVGWRDMAAKMAVVETHIDGELIGSKVLPEFRTDALDVLDFIFDHARKYDIDLPAGTFVSTGAITGVHEASIGSRSTLDFGSFGTLDMELTRAEPIS